MIGPPLVSTIALLFMWSLPFPRLLVYLFGCGLCLIAGIFFVIGLRRMIYGGQWGCFIDDDYMTWTYPDRSGRQGQQIPVQDILHFTVEVTRYYKRGDRQYSFYITTNAGRFEIDMNCFGRARKLASALRRANPEIQLLLIDEGQSQSWRPENAPWWLR